MEHVSSVRLTGKFPEKVENLKRSARFPGWNFRTECRVLFTFFVVWTSSRSTVGHPATYRGLQPNGTTFYQSEIPLLLPPKFPSFFPKWKAPSMFALFPKFGAKTCPQDLWPFFILQTGLKFLIWAQGEIHPCNWVSPVNRAHMKRP